MEVIKLCKIIGIDNYRDLLRFKKENMQPNETLKDCMVRYLIDLGIDFKIKEKKYGK